MLIELVESLSWQGELGAGTLSSLGHEIVHLRLALAPRDRLQVARLWLEDTANGHEALDVVSCDQLFATEDVNEVERL